MFILKCDFEPKVATISDESTLIRQIEMAITTKNMKSIQYPYMPEEGMIEEREQIQKSMEIWAASEKREHQERFEPDQVMEASAQLIEQTPELELKMKLDHVSVNGLLSDFRDIIHLAKANGRYVLLVEADSVLFERGFSPIEFVRPDTLENVIKKIERKSGDISSVR